GDALLGRGHAHQHLGAIGDADAFLHDVVTGAGADVVAVRPYAHARVVGELGPRELVLVVAAERIGGRADRVAHGVGRREHGLHEHPATRQLIPADDRVAVVDVAAALATAAQAREDGLPLLRAQRHAGGRVHRALLRVHGHLPVDDLHDVVRPAGQAELRRIAVARDAVEVIEQRERRLRPLRRLDDRRRLPARTGRAGRSAAATATADAGRAAATACLGPRAPRRP